MNMEHLAQNQHLWTIESVLSSQYQLLLEGRIKAMIVAEIRFELSFGHRKELVAD